jgi:RHS repeat-associated protein
LNERKKFFIFQPMIVARNQIPSPGKNVYSEIFPFSGLNQTLPRLITDHLGSIRVTLDQSGNVDSWTDYYPFGKEARGSSTANRPKEQFTGKERDSEIGLDYFGARYYNSEIGRWLAVDPLSGKYPHASPYNYTLDNPIIFFDPDGRDVKAYSERIQRPLFNAVDVVGRSMGVWQGVLATAMHPRHSFLRVSTDKTDVIIELWGPDGGESGRPRQDPYEEQDRPGQQEHDVEGPMGAENNYELENNILAIYDVIKDNLPAYDPMGPNSNGFVNWLVTKAGGKVKLPVSAVGKNETAAYEKLYQQAVQKKKDKEEAEKEREDEKEREKRHWNKYDPSQR